MSSTRRAATCACLLLAVLLATAACSTGDPGTPTPVPTSTVQAPNQPPTIPPPDPTNSTESTTDPGAEGHGPVDPEATNEPTDAAYMSAKQAAADFTASYLDFGFPDGYATDHLHRAQQHMSTRYFFEQLSVIEDAGANADPYWQQLIVNHRRSIVEVDKIIPGHVSSRKAVVRVRYRNGVVTVDSTHRHEGVPAAATEQMAVLSLVKRDAFWRVDRFERVDSVG
jgi:hypothetical protein